MSKRRDNSHKLPALQTSNELVEFFDTHDLGQYDLPEVQFNVDVKQRKYLVTVDAKLAHQIARIAQAQGMSFEELIHRWLREKIHSEASVVPKRRGL